MSTLSRRSVDRFISQYAGSGRVLDLGCGPSPYARRFPERIGCDIAAGPGVHVLGSAEELPFADECFDQVLSTELLEHLRRPAVAVREMWRVLRPGGRVILTTRFLYPIHDEPHDYFRYTRFGLVALFDGWKIEELREDLDGISSVAQLAEMALNAWPRLVRWPAKAAVRIVRAVARAVNLFARASGLADSRISSGYLLVVRKPGRAAMGAPRQSA